MAEHVRFEKSLNKNYFGEWDLPEDGSDMIVQIDDVKHEQIQSPQGGKEMKTVIYFKGGLKPMIMNSTNLKRVASVCESPFEDEWCGKRIQLYSEMVACFGSMTKAVRVRDFAPDAK